MAYDVSLSTDDELAANRLAFDPRIFLAVRNHGFKLRFGMKFSKRNDTYGLGSQKG